MNCSSTEQKGGRKGNLMEGLLEAALYGHVKEICIMNYNTLPIYCECLEMGSEL